MSTVAKSLAKGMPLEVDGVTYTVSPWAYDVQAEYEKHLIAKSYARLRAAREELGPEYESERASLRRDIDAGDYEFGGSLAMRSLARKENLKHLLYLCLAYAHRAEPGKVTKALVDRIADDPAKFDEACEMMAEANRDPNPPAAPPAAP